MQITKSLIAALLLATLFSSSGVGADDPKIEYKVDLSDAKNHYCTVTANIEPTGPSTELMLPVWTPGSYLIREYARHIDSMTATDEQGNSLEFSKTRKNRWTVESGDANRIILRYRVYCNELTVRTNFVDGQFALLNGAATYVTVAEYRNLAHRIDLELPKKWKRSATSLKSAGQPHSYSASSFDVLVDSPIVAGNIHVYPFEVSGVPHELVNVGESGYWDGESAAADLSKVVAAHHELWGNVPYTRYSFINIICGRGGGLEHDNSTVMLTRRWSFREPTQYISWLSLASHEFFHTWNVRRLRPKSLLKYDYENEVYTPSLWVAEGITSYYQNLMLVRAGLIEQQEFLQRLGRTINSVQNRPGRLVQSLRDSSFDSWIKFYRPSDNSSKTQISYYSKGAAVGFLLDAKIRDVTAGKKSLDDVMRTMFEKYAAAGFQPSDFRQTVAEVCGTDMESFFKKYVDSTDELDFSTAKQHFGLRFSFDADGSIEASESEPTENEQAAGSQSNDQTDSADSEPKPWLGCSLSGGNISSIEVNSPAMQVGLNLGDELIAINSIRIKDGLDRRLRQYSVGDELELLISRRGQLIPIRVTLAPSPAKLTWDLLKVTSPTEQQLSNLDDWLSGSN